MSVIANTLTPPSTPTNAPISVTSNAALKSWELIQAENNPHLKLRVSILGGGCHGFRYQFSFSDTVESDDTIVTAVVPTSDGTTKTVDWVVGLMSLQLLNGIEIDYQSDLGGERFIIRNLNVKTTCSCGHSFSVPNTDERK